MSVKRRNGSKVYYTNFTNNGERIRKSTGTTVKTLAQEYEDKLKDQLWRQVKLGDRPHFTWPEAASRFLEENTHKSKTGQRQDQQRILWFTKEFGDMLLESISEDAIKSIVKKLLAADKTNATVNRYLATLRVIFNKASKEWRDERTQKYWLENTPRIRPLKEPKRRIRFLTREEADRLIAGAPEHMGDMICFSLATGLRQSNVLFLEWGQVNLESASAWIHPDQSKNNKPIGIPLNETALSILNKQLGKHPERVFTYEDRPINTIESRTWKKCLKRAGIDDFRWHDLRHTWASWHVQSGTPLQVLMELGAWSSMDMVLKYAHLSNSYLKSAANNIEIENSCRKTGTGVTKESSGHS